MIYCNTSAVLQQGIHPLRQRMHNDNRESAALKALLDQRSAGPIVSGAQMDKTIARMITEKRRARSVQS